MEDKELKKASQNVQMIWGKKNLAGGWSHFTIIIIHLMF